MNYCTGEKKSPIAILLHILVALLAIYGLWAHNWYVIIAVIILSAICCWFFCKNKQPVEEVKKKKK